MEACERPRLTLTITHGPPVTGVRIITAGETMELAFPLKFPTIGLIPFDPPVMLQPRRYSLVI